MLEADGVLLPPDYADPTTLRFVAPAGVRRLRLVSPSVVPVRIGRGEDRRALGFAVSEIFVRRDGERTRIDPDEITPGDGWHVPEGGHRWTNGDAAIPLTLGAAGAGPMEITVAARPFRP
jgi:hypothetical protein